MRLTHPPLHSSPPHDTYTQQMITAGRQPPDPASQDYVGCKADEHLRRWGETLLIRHRRDGGRLAGLPPPGEGEDEEAREQRQAAQREAAEAEMALVARLGSGEGAFIPHNPVVLAPPALGGEQMHALLARVLQPVHRTPVSHLATQIEKRTKKGALFPTCRTCGAPMLGHPKQCPQRAAQEAAREAEERRVAEGEPIGRDQRRQPTDPLTTSSSSSSSHDSFESCPSFSSSSSM